MIHLVPSVNLRGIPAVHVDIHGLTVQVVPPPTKLCLVVKPVWVHRFHTLLPSFVLTTDLLGFTSTYCPLVTEAPLWSRWWDWLAIFSIITNKWSCLILIAAPIKLSD